MAAWRILPARGGRTLRLWRSSVCALLPFFFPFFSLFFIVAPALPACRAHVIPPPTINVENGGDRDGVGIIDPVRTMTALLLWPLPPIPLWIDLLSHAARQEGDRTVAIFPVSVFPVDETRGSALDSENLLVFYPSIARVLRYVFDNVREK